MKRVLICRAHGLARRFRVDPYLFEIRGITQWRWLCDVCYRDRLDDI